MGEGLDECLCLHAEENALLEAGRERVSGGGTEGAVLYCNTCVGLTRASGEGADHLEVWQVSLP